MHGMKNNSSMGLLWMRQWSSQIRKRSLMRSNSARHGLLFCETLHSNTSVDEDYVLSTGEGLRTFRWNVVPSSRTVGPEDKVNWAVDRAKRPRWLESSLTPLWEFHNHQLLSWNVGSKLPKDAAQKPKRAQISFTPRSNLKSRNCGKVKFSAVSLPRECTDWGWQGVFFVVLFTYMLVISDIRKLSHNR